MPFTINRIITDAIRNGELSQEQIVASYERIVRFKQNYQRGEVMLIKNALVSTPKEL